MHQYLIAVGLHWLPKWQDGWPLLSCVKLLVHFCVRLRPAH